MLNSIKKVPAYYVHKDLRLSIEQQTLRDGKEGCARETIGILSFQNFYKVLKTGSAGRKNFFDTLRSLRTMYAGTFLYGGTFLYASSA